jgi:hypothetical protein
MRNPREELSHPLQRPRGGRSPIAFLKCRVCAAGGRARRSERTKSEDKSIRCNADDKGADLIDAGRSPCEGRPNRPMPPHFSGTAERRCGDARKRVSLSGDRPRTVPPTTQPIKMQRHLLFVKTHVDFQERIFGFFS